MYKCMTCKNKFEKPKRPMTAIWIIFIFFSMGLGLIVWLLSKKRCPYCNSETFIDTKFIQETNDNADSSSYKSFNKVEKEKTPLEKAFYIVIFIFIVVFFTVSNKEDKQEEIQKLEQNIKSIPILSIEENYRGYKKLSEYYPSNKEYKDKMNFYNTRLQVKNSCIRTAYQNNENSLSNKTTFKSVSLDEYLVEQWVDINTFVFQSSFTGKNDYGVEQKFTSKYKCTYNQKDHTTNVERIFINKAK
ncbi:hypothetical protein [Aliarcobacter lanthieri]|uniref:hypothetical protein n=1 Tax=Aliarcobacter lanthieri TaxID=1355374 RepID=UPI000478C2CB|nr:hypothetical protein [Aliarcobacter lanthieri]